MGSEARLRTLYATALHISGGRTAAEESVVTAYCKVQQTSVPSEPGSRFKMPMREVVTAAKRAATALSGHDALPQTDSLTPKVATLLATLDVDRRAAIVLRDVAGLSRSEAAFALGTTPEKFGELLSHGRLTLSERMT